MANKATIDKYETKAVISPYETKVTNIKLVAPSIFTPSNISAFHWEAEDELNYNDTDLVNPLTNFADANNPDAVQSEDAKKVSFVASASNSRPAVSADGTQIYNAQQSYESVYKNGIAFAFTAKLNANAQGGMIAGVRGDSGDNIFLFIRNDGKLHINLTINGVNNSSNLRSISNFIDADSDQYATFIFWIDLINNIGRLRINGLEQRFNAYDISSLDFSNLSINQNLYFFDWNNQGTEGGDKITGEFQSIDLMGSPSSADIQNYEGYYINKYVKKEDYIGQVTDYINIHSPHDVVVNENTNFAFMAGKGDNNSENNGTFFIIDISDINNPVLRGSITSGVGNAQTVLIYNDQYVISFSDNSTKVFDVSDPDNPVVDNEVIGNGRINGSAMSGNYIFAASKSGVIDVYDVSNINNISRVGEYNAATNDGISGPHDIVYFNDHIAIPNQTDADTPHVGIYQVFDSNGDLIPVANWVLKSSVTKSPDMNGANRILQKGNYLYVGNNLNFSNSVIDISDLDNPAWSNTVDADGASPNGMAFWGANRWVTAGNNGYDIWDISDPTSVSLVKRVDYKYLISDQSEFEPGNAHDMEVFDTDKLIITAQYDNRVAIIQLSDT